MKVTSILSILLASVPFSIPSCRGHHEEEHHEAHKIVATTPISQDIVLKQEYVCQIHSQKHIEVKAMAKGYLQEINVKEGQAVKQGDVMFRIMPVLYQAKLEAEQAEAQVAQLELNFTKSLVDKKVVAPNEVLLRQAQLAKAQAKANLAAAELNFTYVKAPFNGIVDKLRDFAGSLVDEGDVLTTLSDNVPEARYLEYMADIKTHQEEKDVDLILANQSQFDQRGTITAIEAKFNNETGNIAFRADFPNPERLLRHGQTGKVVLHKTQKGSILVPQRATFETLAKRYVFVVGDDHVVHQREIMIQNELDDLFVLKGGVKTNEVIVLDGIRQIKDGDKVEFEMSKTDEVYKIMKYHAE